MDLLQRPNCSCADSPVLAGASLEEAYVEMLNSCFAVKTEALLMKPGPLLLSGDVSAAYARLTQRLGIIDRHPALACAGDDWDLVASQLVGSGAISIEEARDDVLVHRFFWQSFLDGT